jgi:ribosome biogenesis GTPase
VFSAALANLGFDSFFQQQWAAAHRDGLVPVRVMNVERSGLHLVGESTDMHYAPSNRDHEWRTAVGDWALLNTESGRLEQLLERKTVFKRRAPGSDSTEQYIAANVDTLFVVSSCNRDFNVARLERYLAIARESGAMVAIVLTRADLTDNPGPYVAQAAKLKPGIQVEAVNALQKSSLACLDPWLGNGQTIALLGSSGVGKSTIVNTLLGDEHVRTQAIREDDARGRHTTTSRSMHHLPGGAWLLDTPGMRELQLTDVRSGLDDVFEEISGLAENCRFTDCEHDNEPGCAVQKAVTSGQLDQDRLRRWRKLVREDALNSASIAQRRERDKARGRLYKSIIKQKNSLKDL